MQEQNARSSAARAVVLDAFGGPDVLHVRDVPAPEAGPGQARVRVTAVGLNSMDWFMTADADTAARFGLSQPAGFGTDYAGVVDQVGDGVVGFAVGDRVFGGARCSAPPPPREGSPRVSCRSKPVPRPSASGDCPPGTASPRARSATSAVPTCAAVNTACAGQAWSCAAA
jgi:D-arabinose 1-dehydrogenase-like Zn-dependent alcohol dehydrogenase